MCSSLDRVFRVQALYKLLAPRWSIGHLQFSPTVLCPVLVVQFGVQFGSSPGRGHCVVFLGKALYSHRASPVLSKSAGGWRFRWLLAFQAPATVVRQNLRSKTVSEHVIISEGNDKQ